MDAFDLLWETFEKEGVEDTAWIETEIVKILENHNMDDSHIPTLAECEILRHDVYVACEE